MDHCLDIQEEPQNLEQILSDCKETLKYCVKTGEWKEADRETSRMRRLHLPIQLQWALAMRILLGLGQTGPYNTSDVRYIYGYINI